MRNINIAGFGPIVPDVASESQAPRRRTPHRAQSGNWRLPPRQGRGWREELRSVAAGACAQSCFGNHSWPADIPAPQAWLEFDVDNVDRRKWSRRAIACSFATSKSCGPDRPPFSFAGRTARGHHFLRPFCATRNSHGDHNLLVGRWGVPPISGYKFLILQTFAGGNAAASFSVHWSSPPDYSQHFRNQRLA